VSRPPTPEWEQDGPERLYVITGGRSVSAGRDELDLVTLVVARSAPRHGMQPEHAAILRMCQYPLSMAEVSAYLRLPFSAVAVLVADLLAERQVEVRSAARTAGIPDPELIKAVMYGLQKL
jgi:hypothetical protein